MCFNTGFGPKLRIPYSNLGKLASALPSNSHDMPLMGVQSDP